MGGGHGQEIEIPVNQWMYAPGSVPPWLSTRIPLQPWQQVLGEISAIFMSREGVDPVRQPEALLALEQRFGPQLGASSVSSGVYRYQRWHDKTSEDDSARWEDALWHFLRIEFAPDGAAPAAMTAFTQPPGMVAMINPGQVQMNSLR